MILAIRVKMWYNKKRKLHYVNFRWGDNMKKSLFEDWSDEVRSYCEKTG